MKRDTIIEAGLNAIPYVGGSLATLYFGSKEEKRFERLELFYKRIKDELDKNPIDSSHFKKHNKEELENLIEDLNTRLEIETRDDKVEYFKNFFITTIEKPIVNDFDERKTFLSILDSMSSLECQLLSFISKSKRPLPIRSFTGADIYIIYGGISKLISYGFLETRRGSFTMNGQQDENLDNLVFASSYGKKFIEYIKMK